MSRSRIAPHLRLCGLALALGACGGDDAGTGNVEDTEIDTNVPPADTVLDIISFDTQPSDTAAPDTTSPPDTSVPPDTQPADTQTPDTGLPETSEGCNTFGCTCDGNSDCLDELCIEGPDGNICTRTCVADCPANFDCLSVTTFGDPVSACVPRHTRLCRPCREDAECDDPGDPYPAYCLADPTDNPAGATGKFCGSSCANRACPEGYACEDVALSGGGTAKQCVPVSGECACRPAWSDFGYSTDCLLGNQFGYCEGTRSCGENGLTACIGQQASPELCDGEDNDCNGAIDDIDATACYVQNEFGSCPGTYECVDDAPRCVGPVPQVEACNGEDDNCNDQVDENSCNDNLACTTDSCVAPFQCQNVLANGYCLVQGQCYQNGNYNPLNVCEVCDPAKSTIAFSQASNTCLIGGQCFPANAVNPANACQICIPSQGSTTWSTVANTCQIGGQCYAANQPNPNNSCEICQPGTSTVAWTQALNTCNIQGQCYAANVKNPANECEICDPSKSATGWSNAPITQSCDDGNACSATSFCNGAGTCTGDTSCNDNVPCTVDVCGRGGCVNTDVADGWCQIDGVCQTANVANPSNPCQLCAPGTSKTAWSPQPTNVSCSDNNLCTQGDACDGAGSCKPGPGCNDGLSCTTDTCNPQVGCSYPTSAGNCRINDICYADNITQPNNVCYKCNSTASASAWSLNNGASCNDGNSCTNGDTCGSGTCTGNWIRDAFENNDTEATPYNLGDYTDRQDWPQRTINTPTISGPGDVDWYLYFVDDVAFADIEPYVKVSVVDPAFDIELCIFFHCTDDNAVPSNLDCAGALGAAAGNVVYNGKTYKGCCRDATDNGGEESMRFQASATSDSEMECNSSDDDFKALVRIRDLNGNTNCNNAYTLQIGDD